MWFALVTSEAGDWAGRLALAALVYARTGSATWSAAAFAASLLPWVGIGQVLSTLADRYGRRRVMVVSDLARAAAFGLLSLPVPPAALLAIAFLAGVATPPFAAARSAAIPDLVPRGQIGAAIALNQMTSGVAVVAGYLLGGALLAAAGPVPALGANAMTYLVSAVLLSRLPALRPAHRVASGRGPLHACADLMRAGWAALADDPLVRRAAVLATVAAGAATGVESLVVPHVQLSWPAADGASGAVLASVAAITMLGTAVAPTGAGERRLLAATVGMCILPGVLVGLLLLAGNPFVAVLGFAGAGLLFLPLVTANVLISPRLPAASRASAFSLLMGSLALAQAVCSALGGLLADLTSPHVAAAALVSLPVVAGLLARRMPPPA
jgi:MFS family permease